MRWSPSLACRLVLALAAACGGDGGGEPASTAGTGAAMAGTGAMAGAGAAPGMDVSFAGTVQPLFDLACNCHQSDPLMAPFSLKAGEAYDNIVGVPSMQLPTMNLVAPGKLNDSYLWHKVNGTQLEVGGSGGRMPLTIPLSDDEAAILERWIAAGAPR
jgi:hypothetical protein